MRRICQGGRILYVERHRLWSFLYLISSCVALCCAYAFMEQKDLQFAGIMTGGAILLAGLAVANLVRARVFVIDREQGRLEVFDRRFLRKGTRALLPLKALEVSLESRTTSYCQPRSGRFAWMGTTHNLRITVKGSDPIVVARELQGPGGEMLAKALAIDLDRPLRRVDRSF